jgi:hypothetical protein
MSDARSIIHALVDLDPAGDGPYKNITAEQGDQIAFLFDGDFDLFRQLDEQPGRYTSPYYHGVDGEHGYSHWHYKLRQARNDTDNRFFDILNDPSQFTGEPLPVPVLD